MVSLSVRQTNLSWRLFDRPCVFVFPLLYFLWLPLECAYDCRSKFLYWRNRLDVFFERTLPRLVFLLTTLSVAIVLYHRYLRPRLVAPPLFGRPQIGIDTVLRWQLQSFLFMVHLLRTWSLEFGGHLTTRPRILSGFGVQQVQVLPLCLDPTTMATKDAPIALSPLTAEEEGRSSTVFDVSIH